MQNSDNTEVGELINAIINHDSCKVNELLNAGIDPNKSIDSNQITALHFAAQINALTIVPLLIQAGADIDAQTEPNGQTALDIACAHKHIKMVDLLINYANNKSTRAN